MRYGAAIATARVTEDGEKLAARVIAILEDAVNDSALGADLRESLAGVISTLTDIAGPLRAASWDASSITQTTMRV